MIQETPNHPTGMYGFGLAHGNAFYSRLGKSVSIYPLLRVPTLSHELLDLLADSQFLFVGTEGSIQCAQGHLQDLFLRPT